LSLVSTTYIKHSANCSSQHWALLLWQFEPHPGVFRHDVHLPSDSKKVQLHQTEIWKKYNSGETYVGRSTGGMGEGWTIIKTKIAFLACQNLNTEIFRWGKKIGT